MISSYGIMFFHCIDPSTHSSTEVQDEGLVGSHGAASNSDHSECSTVIL